MAANRSSWRIRLLACIGAIGALAVSAAAASSWDVLWDRWLGLWAAVVPDPSVSHEDIDVVGVGGTQDGDILPAVMWSLTVFLIGSLLAGRAWRWWRRAENDASGHRVVDPSELEEWSPVGERTQDAPGAEIVQLPDGTARRRARHSQHG